jgi:hypothetical protein
MCPCGNEEYTGEETAAYFLFGCPSTDSVREAFYTADKWIRGAVKADKFRKFEVAVKKYMTAMRWLDGGTGMREAAFDAWLAALLDMPDVTISHSHNYIYGVVGGAFRCGFSERG